MLPLMDCKVLCLPAAIYAIYKAHDHERLFSPYIVHAYNIFSCSYNLICFQLYNSITLNLKSFFNCIYIYIIVCKKNILHIYFVISENNEETLEKQTYAQKSRRRSKSRRGKRGLPGSLDCARWGCYRAHQAAPDTTRRFWNRECAHPLMIIRA